MIFSSGLAAQHRIIGQSFSHLCHVQLEAARNFFEDLVAQVAIFVLCVHHHGNQRGALDRVAPDELLEFGVKLRGHLHQRSTSPKTISIVPMLATTSASSLPITRCGSAWRLMNDGARILTRYGRFEPSLTTKKPTSPRGDSIA